MRTPPPRSRGHGRRNAVHWCRDLLCEEDVIDLVGQWQAPVTEVLAELSRPYGTSPITCDGPFVVHFGDDMQFSTGFDVRCDNMGMTARGLAELTGTYEVGDGTFTVLGATGSGWMEIAGTAVPLPIIDGYRQGLSGAVPYTIADDQLHYSFVAPDGNTFRFTLVRV